MEGACGCGHKQGPGAERAKLESHANVGNAKLGRRDQAGAPHHVQQTGAAAESASSSSSG